MAKLIIDEKTNTLVRFQTNKYWNHFDYVVVPHQHEGKQIDAIGPHCFNNCIIDLLCIEEGVKRLEDSAFEKASCFDIKCPKGLKIGKRCFANSQLRKILLPHDLTIIKDQTFLGCKELESIWARTGVATIGYDAFANCEKLKDAHFRILKTIKDKAFQGCSHLENIELGHTVRQLGKRIFAGCSNLNSLEIVGEYDKIDARTFEEANGIKSLTLYSNATELYIPPNCFDDTVLEEITLLGYCEPIIEHHSCLPENILVKVPKGSKFLNNLAFYFNFEII